MVASIRVNTAESGDLVGARKLQAKQTLRSLPLTRSSPFRRTITAKSTFPVVARGRQGARRRWTPHSCPLLPHPHHGLCPGALRRIGGPRFPVQIVRPGAGGAPVHAVRACLLRPLSAALGGAAAPVPAAVPAPGARRAVPGATSAQPRPEAAHPVRLPPPRLRPLGAAERAGGARRTLRLRPCQPPPPGQRFPAGRPGQWGPVRAGGLPLSARDPPRRGRGLTRGAAGRLRQKLEGARASGLEAAREGAPSAALGAAGRGAAHRPQVPGEVDPVHGSRPQLRQGPGWRPRRGKAEGWGTGE